MRINKIIKFDEDIDKAIVDLTNDEEKAKVIKKACSDFAELPREQREKALALLTLDYLVDYKPLLAYVEKPFMLDKFDQLSSMEIKSMGEDNFKAKEAQAKMLDKMWKEKEGKIKNYNISNREWLKHCREVLAKSDHVGVAKFDMILEEFYPKKKVAA